MAIDATTNNNPMHGDLHQNAGMGSIKPSAFANCIKPLLQALEWPGNERHLLEVLPHFQDSVDIYDFLQVFNRLHYSHKVINTMDLMKIDKRLLPCLFINEDHEPLIILETAGPRIEIFNGRKNRKEIISQESMIGTIYIFGSREEEEKEERTRTTSWFRNILKRYKRLFYQILGIGLILNLLALAVPLYIMAVYDRVISTGSVPMLSAFITGAFIALLGTAALQIIRAKILAYIGARLDAIVGNAILEHLLYLSPNLTENASVGAQVARIKDFDSVREFFTGPIIGVVFELPFVIIFIAVIWMLGGTLAYIPLAMVFIFILITLMLQPSVKQNVNKTALTGAARQSFLLEVLANVRTIKHTATEEKWFDRYRELSAEATLAGYKASITTALTNIISDAIMIISGMAILSFGVLKVLGGSMTIGALIATMILVWRVLTPLKSVFSSLTRIDQLRAGIRQVNNLMDIAPERDPHALIEPITNLKGNIKFNRVSIRYAADADPALLGITFDMNHGELLAVLGRNGSGKSTLLKLIPGLYLPQAGGIRIDDRDIRQLDPVELRHRIGYVPQQIQLFYGTIAQNLQLANPLATKEDMAQAAKMAGIYEEIMKLQDGFDYRLRDQSNQQLPISLQQGLALARAYVKKPAIYLFDEPVNALDNEGEKQFFKTIGQLRGESSILLVTHNPAHIQMADKVMLLHEGHLLVCGPTNEILEKLPKEYR